MAIALQSNTAYTDGYAQVRIVIENGVFAFENANAVVGGVPTYNIATMRLLSIYEAGGTLYAESSADGTNWNPVSNLPFSAITARGFKASAVHLVVYAGTTNMPTTAPGTALFGPAQLVTA
jgi:hypothetical protein